MEKIGRDTTVFMFDKLFDFSTFIDEADAEIATGRARNWLNTINSPNYISSEITSSRRRSYGAAWFGTTDLSLINNNYTTYLFNNELSLFLNGLRNRTVQANIVDIDQKKKIKFTEQEIGIFSFDLASLGLIKVVEYFSKNLNEVVDSNNVRSKKSQDGKLKFYFIGMKAVRRHMLKKTELGLWSPVLNKFIPEEKAIREEKDGVVNYYYEQESISEHEVEQRQVVENGKKKFTTTWKKSFIHIPKVNKKIPRIDLIINSAYSWKVKGDTEMIWSCMAGVALAEKLQAAGINFRVFVSYSHGFENNKKVYSFVKVKDASDPVNINAIAIAVSDPRQFRYLGFKAAVTTAWAAGYDSDILTGSLSIPLNNSDDIKKAFIDYLEKQKDFDNSSGEIFQNAKIVITQTLSEQAAIDKFNEIVEKISETS